MRVVFESVDCSAIGNKQGFLELISFYVFQDVTHVNRSHQSYIFTLPFGEWKK